MNMMNLKTVLFFLTLTIISFTNSVTINQNQNSFVDESSKQCKKVGGVGAIVNRPVVDGWKNYYMLDNVNRIQAETKISKWTIFAKRAKPVQLFIYRKSGGRFTVVGKSALENAKMGANTFYLTKPIKANKGDYIGWYVPQLGVIAFTLNVSGRWMDKNLSQSTLFTHYAGNSATAFRYSSPRTYSINVLGCDDSESSKQCKKVGGVGKIVNRAHVDGAKNYYMIDNVNRIQANTKISKWTIFAKRAKPVQLVIYRKSGGRFTVVGKSALENAKMGVNTFSLTKPIRANEGDYIGWYVPQNGVIAFTLNVSGKWFIRDLNHSVLSTLEHKSATAFHFSSPRTYSIQVTGCDDKDDSDDSDDSDYDNAFKCDRKGGSDATKSRPVVDGWKNYYMIDNVNRIKGKATIFEFKIYAKSLKPVQCIIYRKVGSKFTVVGKSLLETPKKLGLNVFEINHTINVLPGDYIGWYVPQGGVIAFTLNVSGKWLVRNLSQSTLFTAQGKSATALQYSSPRTYSIEVIGC